MKNVFESAGTNDRNEIGGRTCPENVNRWRLQTYTDSMQRMTPREETSRRMNKVRSFGAWFFLKVSFDQIYQVYSFIQNCLIVHVLENNNLFVKLQQEDQASVWRTVPVYSECRRFCRLACSKMKRERERVTPSSA